MSDTDAQGGGQTRRAGAGRALKNCSRSVLTSESVGWMVVPHLPFVLSQDVGISPRLYLSTRNSRIASHSALADAVFLGAQMASSSKDLSTML